MDRKELSSKTVTELKKLAQEQKIAGISKKTKDQIIDLLLEKAQKEEKPKAEEPSKVSQAPKKTPQAKPAHQNNKVVNQTKPVEKPTQNINVQKSEASVNTNNSQEKINKSYPNLWESKKKIA